MGLPPLPRAPGEERRPRWGRGHGEAEKPEPDWQPTNERFRDPRTRNVLRVWVDGAGESQIEESKNGQTIGAVRNILYDGRRIRQRLLAQSDLDRSQTYAFCGPPPAPLRDYQATLRVTPIVDGDCVHTDGSTILVSTGTPGLYANVTCSNATSPRTAASGARWASSASSVIMRRSS